VRDAPAFYLRMANPWVMLFFKPEDVVAWLKQPAFVQPNKYLDMISKDLPLEEDTDLFKYVLADSDLFHTQDVLVSDLLKLGQVRIDDWPFANSKRDPFYDRQDPTTVIMVSKKFDNFEEEWRLFCEPLRNKGETREIFEITYVIVD
jgi:hypothetical protein